ncbi:hypothetical protein RhiirA4_457493 [Rhizophagus irregularis]|uniref:Uncharacterized protein n=1 Tax=Rhizophagus irregularis TaxID=588596 RepID=A0A2I1GA34_9GLOM|nr:hypothetical protein RhiirA4_457493 [Rhizophagus irregularis]
MHQADVLYTRHVKSRRTIYLFYLNVKDVASEAIVPIGVALKGPAKSIKNMQGILTSSTIAKCLEKIYDDPENPLIWPKVFLSDGELKDLAGVVDSIVEDLNNSVTRLLSMTSTEAIKKKSVFAKPSKPRKGPVGYDEERLSYDNSVIYLLDSSEYEGGRRRATDMNWSSKIYQIRESLIQKNQPVLYWLIDDEGNGPEKSFVREKLQIVPPDVEYLPQWVLVN